MLFCPCPLLRVYLLSTPVGRMPNARGEPPISGATQERRLLAVACRPMLGREAYPGGTDQRSDGLKPLTKCCDQCLIPLDHNTPCGERVR
jgi:hypothetical protein